MDTPGTSAPATPTSSTIVILDFGSQYTQLIARRIREFNVFSVVLPCTAPLEQVKALNPKGVILSGGPCSVYDADAPAADKGVLEMGVPVPCWLCMVSPGRRSEGCLASVVCC